jgi:hypothetical protein
MKTNKLVLIGILLVAFAAMVAPVMAATDSETATVTGTLPATMVLSIDTAPGALDLSGALGDKTSTNGRLGVISNYPGWVVSVKDNQTKAAGDRGYMFEHVTAGNIFIETNHLTAALKVATPTATGYTGLTEAALTSTLTFATGESDADAVNTFSIPINLKQTIGATDMGLASGRTYQTIITFDGSTA